MKKPQLIVGSVVLTLAALFFTFVVSPAQLLHDFLHRAYLGSASLLTFKNGNTSVQVLMDERDVTLFLANQDSTPYLYLFDLPFPNTPFSVNLTKDGQYLVISCEGEGGSQFLIDLSSLQRIYPIVFSTSMTSSAKRTVDSEPVDQIVSRSGGIGALIVDDKMLSQGWNNANHISSSQGQKYTDLVAAFIREQNRSGGTKK